jgi:hypothetical protein
VAYEDAGRAPANQGLVAGPVELQDGSWRVGLQIDWHRWTFDPGTARALGQTLIDSAYWAERGTGPPDAPSQPADRPYDQWALERTRFQPGEERPDS